MSERKASQKRNRSAEKNSSQHVSAPSQQSSSTTTTAKSSPACKKQRTQTRSNSKATHSEFIWPQGEIIQIGQKVADGECITKEDAMLMFGKNAPFHAPWFENPPNMKICSIAPMAHNASVSAVDAGVIKAMVISPSAFLKRFAQIHKTGVKDEIGRRVPAGEMSMEWSRNGLNYFYDCDSHTREDWSMGITPASEHMYKAQTDIFSLPYQTPGLGEQEFKWLPDYSVLNEEQLVAVRDSGSRGSMLLKWPEKLLSLLSPEGKGLLDILKSYFDKMEWTRTLAGGTQDVDGNHFSHDSFSNINLSDRFGRIYHMVCIFNNDNFWGFRGQEAVVRINFGFLIYHIMLTIMGAFVSSSSSSHGVKLVHGSWGVSTKAISDQISSNKWDIRFLGRLGGTSTSSGSGDLLSSFLQMRTQLAEEVDVLKIPSPSQPDSLLCLHICSHGEIVMMKEGVEKVLTEAKKIQKTGGGSGGAAASMCETSSGGEKKMPSSAAFSEYALHARPTALFLFNCKPYEQPIDAHGNYENQQELLDNPQYQWADSISRSIIEHETAQTRTAILASGMTTRSEPSLSKFGDVVADLEFGRYGMHTSIQKTMTRAQYAQVTAAKRAKGIPEKGKFGIPNLILGAMINQWGDSDFLAASPIWKSVKNKMIASLGGEVIILPHQVYTEPYIPSLPKITIKEILEYDVFLPSSSSSNKGGGAQTFKQLTPKDKMSFIYKSIAANAALETKFDGMNEDIKRTILGKKFGGRRKKTKKRCKKKKKKKTKKTKRVKKKKTRRKKRRKSRKK